MADKYKELGCDSLNEAECEEAVEEEGLDINELEEEYFEDGESS